MLKKKKKRCKNPIIPDLVVMKLSRLGREQMDFD